MTTYIVHRLFQTLVMMFILSIVFFLLVHYQPITTCFNLSCAQAQHLDQPIATQYLEYVGRLAHGDLGRNAAGNSIGQEIRQKLPATVLLITVSFVMQQLIALPLGMYAALRRYSAFDQILTLVSYVFLSVPAFVLGLVIVYFGAVQFGWFPVGHSQDEALPLLWTSDWFHAVTHDPGYVLGDMIRHLVLPAFVLMVTGIAVDSRFMRASMLQVLHQDYIRTARAKGLSRRSVIFKHAFRNAILPIVTNIGLYLPTLVGGVIVVETVFTWGGLGYMFSVAVRGGVSQGIGLVADVPTLEALLLLSALAVLIANLAADLAYAWLDPRIRFDSGEAE
jgi:peptide/nickel transport system permease protein